MKMPRVDYIMCIGASLGSPAAWVESDRRHQNHKFHTMTPRDLRRAQSTRIATSYINI